MVIGLVVVGKVVPGIIVVVGATVVVEVDVGVLAQRGWALIYIQSKSPRL